MIANIQAGSLPLLQRIAMALVSMALAGLLAACGGGNGSPPPAAPLPAAITAQPTDQSAVAGTAATFSVTATNATGYQWQRSAEGGATFADVAGAVATSHTTAATTLADSDAQYRVVVSGAANSVTSSGATLRVTAAMVAPSISVQPAPQTVIAGQSVSLAVTAEGTNLAYQWEASFDGVSFGAAAGETNATLTVPAAPVSASGMRFRVVVSNSLGSVTSTAALLTVIPAMVGRFAYVANSDDNTVSIYTVNAVTGQLRHNGYVAGFNGTGPVAVDPLGKFAYVPNAITRNISAFTIHPATGALDAVAGSPFAAGTGGPVTVDPSGKFAYVLGGPDNVSAYTTSTPSVVR